MLLVYHLFIFIALIYCVYYCLARTGSWDVKTIVLGGWTCQRYHVVYWLPNNLWNGQVQTYVYNVTVTLLECTTEREPEFLECPPLKCTTQPIYYTKIELFVQLFVFVLLFVRSFVFVCSFLRLFVHPFVSSLVHSSLRPSVLSLVHPSVRSSVSPSVHLFVCWFIRPSVHPSVRPSVCSLVHLSQSVRSSVRSLVHPSIRPSVHPSFVRSLMWRDKPLRACAQHDSDVMLQHIITRLYE